VKVNEQYPENDEVRAAIFACANHAISSKRTAKRGIATVRCLSVRPSVCLFVMLMYRGHI